MQFSASETFRDPGPYPKEVIFQNIDLALSGKQDIRFRLSEAVTMRPFFRAKNGGK